MLRRHHECDRRNPTESPRRSRHHLRRRRDVEARLSRIAVCRPAEPEGDLDSDEGPEDESALSGLLAEDEDAKEAPKLCPNCGGNWILYKDGEYTCRICGENW